MVGGINGNIGGGEVTLVIDIGTTTALKQMIRNTVTEF